MSMQKHLSLIGKITEIALNEAIRGWQPPVQGQLYCPFCQSDRVYQRTRRKQGMTHICSGCDQSFSQELIRECRCLRPGKFVKCLTCPQYQQIRKLMKANVEQLRYLSEAEVNQIVKHSDFYQEGFSVQQIFPHLKMRCYAERETTIAQATDDLNQPIDYDSTEQLSLFE